MADTWEISGNGWTDTYETYRYSMRWFDGETPMNTYYQYRNGFLERIEIRPEETGCTAGRIVPLGAIYPSPGFLTEVTYLFAALDLTEGEMQPDEDEFVEVVRLPIAEVEKMIERDEIRDAKTVAAMYRAKLKNLY